MRGFDFFAAFSNMQVYIFNNGVAAFNISWSNMCPHPLPLEDFGNEENYLSSNIHRKKWTTCSGLMKTAMNNVLLPTLFNVVNNIVQHCWAWISLQSGVTMLNNIVDNIEQCGQQNIVHCCFHQARTIFCCVYMFVASSRFHVFSLKTQCKIRYWVKRIHVAIGWHACDCKGWRGVLTRVQAWVYTVLLTI